MTNGATIPQPRNEDGTFVSIGTLFERERIEHQRDHEQERIVAKETAQRLEREVEQTALRLERIVEETAVRLEKGVETALRAVAETARVHAEAHSREHLAHERIHTVEKDQVDKASIIREREAEALGKSLSEYKAASNEWRGALRDQASNYVTREAFERESGRIIALEKSIVGRETFAREHERLIQIEKKMAYYAGAAAAAGAIIALVIRLLGVGG